MENEELEKLARMIDGAPVEILFQILTVIAADLQERGEPVSCALFIAMAAREVGSQEELHKLLHEWNDETETTNRFDRMVEQIMKTRPPRPSDN